MDTLTMIATTLNKWSETAFDSVLERNALLYVFKRIGKLKNMVGQKNIGSIAIAPGGRNIEEDVVLNPTSNAGWVDYDGDLATAETKNIAATAEFPWKIVYANAVAYKAQILANQTSKYRKHDMIKVLVDNAENTLINNIGQGLFNLTSANAKSMNGLPELITDDGTGTVGGISATTFANWKNQFENLPKTHTPAQLREKMGKLYRKCRNGVDVIVTTSDLYGEYEASLEANVHQTSLKALEDAWFEYLRFHGAVVIWDDNCPANRMYFLNTASIKLNFMKGAEIQVGEMEHPAGTMKYIWPVIAMCNWSIRARRDLGVLVVATTDPTNG